MQVFGSTVRFGVQAGASRVSYTDYLANWQRCKELGYDVGYATDHFVSSLPETGVAPVFESTTLVSAMAAQTLRMRCGLMVAGNTFRNPAILAKIGETQAEVEDRSREQTRFRSRGTPEQVAEGLLSFVKLGVSDVVFILDPAQDLRSLELLATQVAPYVREEGSTILAGTLTSQPV